MVVSSANCEILTFWSSGAEMPLQSEGSFKWKEDDPSARIILEGSFGLHAKTWLLGPTFHLVYMQDRPSTFVFGAVAKQDGGRQ